MCFCVCMSHCVRLRVHVRLHMCACAWAWVHTCACLCVCVRVWYRCRCWCWWRCRFGWVGGVGGWGGWGGCGGCGGCGWRGFFESTFTLYQIALGLKKGTETPNLSSEPFHVLPPSAILAPTRKGLSLQAPNVCLQPSPPQLNRKQAQDPCEPPTARTAAKRCSGAATGRTPAGPRSPRAPEGEERARGPHRVEPSAQKARPENCGSTQEAFKHRNCLHLKRYSLARWGHDVRGSALWVFRVGELSVRLLRFADLYREW